MNDNRPMDQQEHRRAFLTRDGGRAVLIPVDLHRPDAICRKHGTAAKRVRRRVDGRKVKVWLCGRCAEEAQR